MSLPDSSAGASPYHARRFHTRSKNARAVTVLLDDALLGLGQPVAIHAGEEARGSQAGFRVLSPRWRGRCLNAGRRTWLSAVP